jgi:lysozyme
VPKPLLLRRLFGWTALIAGILALAYGFAIRWSPPRTDFAQQGPMISADNGAVRWPQLRTSAPDFVYIMATRGSKGRDDQFVRNREGALAQGIPYGAVHVFAFCESANDQSANFDIFVPRDPGALPAIILLDIDNDCQQPPTRALIVSELTTFLNQIEAHLGKPVIIAPSAEFEETYQISRAINRPIMVRGDYFVPDYVSRRWAMWQANSRKIIAGVDGVAPWNVIAAKK